MTRISFHSDSHRQGVNPCVPTPLAPNGGFTLLEVLISSAILAVVMILLIGMANHTTSLWHRGERHRDASREVRAGLQMITEDLHSAVLTTNPATLDITPNHTNGGSALFFLVSHPGEKQAADNEGDLCATGYFIAEDPRQQGVGNLYRFHASGASVTRAFEQNKLQALYASASLTNTATTELLARRLVKLDVRRVEGESTSGGLLMISLSTPRDGKAVKKDSTLQDEQLLRYSTIIRLPPQRELAGTNSF